MTTLTEQQIRQTLTDAPMDLLGIDPLAANLIKAIRTNAQQVTIDLELGFPCQSYLPEFTEALRSLLQTRCGAQNVTINTNTKITAHAVQQGTTPLPEVKNIIAVASGKGGVGKSTTAVNFALALQAEGAQAALLDADIYGPSLPLMLGVTGKPETIDGKFIEPLVSYGVQMMSIGNLIDAEQPMVWRGPMVTSALQQLLSDTAWHGVDYLVIDLPPGTGDIQLTLCQKVPVSAAVIVTTPQDIALLDARRALKMFEKVNVPVLGIIENMSTHVCSHCGHEEHIFGAGGGQSMAQQYDVELLGALPLDRRIREGVDNGKPTVAMDPQSAVAQAYRDIACRLAAKLSLRAKDYSAKFPKIVIQNT
jgi:ATP-binding protein involved in chromosome partitioning